MLIQPEPSASACRRIGAATEIPIIASTAGQMLLRMDRVAIVVLWNPMDGTKMGRHWRATNGSQPCQCHGCR